jgi:hypothetical protein
MYLSKILPDLGQIADVNPSPYSHQPFLEMVLAARQLPETVMGPSTGASTEKSKKPVPYQ